MTKRIGVLTLAMTLLSIPAARAQDAEAPLPATVTIEQVLALLKDRSPRTAADRAAIAVAAADRVSATLLPNPSVSYGGVHLTSGQSTGAITQHQAIVEQPLLIFKQRQARVAQADQSVKTTEAQVADVEAQRQLAVRQAFASLLARQEQLQVVTDSVTDLDRVAQLVRGRAAAGERSQYDVARVETEAETLRVQSMNAATDVEDAARHLAALLGLAGWSPRAVGMLDAGSVTANVDMLWEIAQRQKPALIAVREQQSLARGGLGLARRERLPVPVVSGGTQITQDVTGTSAFFGVSVPLPFFDRGQGALAKATAAIDEQELTLKATLAETRAEIERAAVVLSRRRDALTRLENGVVQRAPALRQMAEDAYREGSGDVLDLLDAMRAWREIQITHIEQLESTRLAEEDVVAAAGL